MQESMVMELQQWSVLKLSTLLYAEPLVQASAVHDPDLHSPLVSELQLHLISIQLLSAFKQQLHPVPASSDLQLLLLVWTTAVFFPPKCYSSCLQCLSCSCFLSQCSNYLKLTILQLISKLISVLQQSPVSELEPSADPLLQVFTVQVLLFYCPDPNADTGQCGFLWKQVLLQERCEGWQEGAGSSG